jgi:hypothetical protein
MERNCEACGEPIPAARLEALPETTTCVSCSTATKQTGYMVGTASKGCAATLMMIPDDPEAQRLAKRAHLRSR